VSGELAPGPRRPLRAPLPTAALVVGATLAALALALALLRTPARALATDPIVVRAFGATLAAASFMLARVAVRHAAGNRRAFALAIAGPVMGLGAALLAAPRLAMVPYERGWAVAVPWLLGVPALLALGLSRWRVGS
jgi:hypothetical protein